MQKLPTLRQELITALAVIFTGALTVGILGAILLTPYFTTPARALLFLALLLIGDVVTFALFGRYLLQRRVLAPIESVIGGVEAIAEGAYHLELPDADTVEVARLSDAVRSMGDRLGAHQEQLAANIRSLEETNRQLTDARNELIRSANIATAGRLSAGIAHEVGNPLGAIMGYLGLLRRHVDPERAKLVDSAEGEAQRIDRIVRGLLDFARPREMNPRPIDVNEVAQTTLDLVRDQGKLAGIDIDVALADDLPPVNGDPYQLQQVLVNLMLNAADALEHTASPRIEIHTVRIEFRPRRRVPIRREDDPPEIDYSHRRRYHQMPRMTRDEPFRAGEPIVQIVLVDNGPGIPEDLREQIFEPFVTTKEPGKGTGLGLALSARMIDAMGGTIMADRADIGGARFTILLPATAQVETTA
ncbi:MAG TPA: ATP-binding protein [Longimicrobiales bacterium]|nr:ATP-binding protein [Longimicrobiales bacterium]